MSKKLIGTDDKSNVSNFKYTHFVEICPLCKDDLLYLPKKTANSLGNISRLVLVKNVSNVIRLVDPLSGQIGAMNPETFWRDPIRPIIQASRSRLTRYVVLGKEPVVLEDNASKRQKIGSRRRGARLAAVTMAKEDDLGTNDSQVYERSHVGYLLKSGDVCVGYDLRDTQLAEDDADEASRAGKFPDAVVVRKLYGGAAAAAAAAADVTATLRPFRLKRLDVKVSEGEGEDAMATDEETGKKKRRGRKKKGEKKDAMMNEVDEEEFLREVEADREMRVSMNLYKAEVGRKKAEAEAAAESADATMDNDDDDDDDDQRIKLDELLDGLVLDAGPDDADRAPKKVIESSEGDDTWDMGRGGEIVEEGERAARDGIAFLGRDEARNLVGEGKEAPVPVKEFVDKDFQFL